MLHLQGRKKKQTPAGILLLRTRVQWHNFNVNLSIAGGTSPYCWVSQVAQRKTGQSLSKQLANFRNEPRGTDETTVPVLQMRNRARIRAFAEVTKGQKALF